MRMALCRKEWLLATTYYLVGAGHDGDRKAFDQPADKCKGQNGEVCEGENRLLTRA